VRSEQGSEYARHENKELHKLKLALAAQVIKALDAQKLSARVAQGRIGIAAADLSRVRHSHLGRFTVDRLMTILKRLGVRVEVKVTVRGAGRANGRAKTAGGQGSRDGKDTSTLG
jgi:predicted XRE-type DNA-binding protein